MRDDLAYLADIFSACEAITEFVGGHTVESSSASKLINSAEQLQLAIIGEAAGKLSEPTRAVAPSIPWQRVKRFRNVLIHDYLGVDLRTVWEIATVRVPELSIAVRLLLPAP